MSDQIGFDFGDIATVIGAAHPRDWRDPEHFNSQWLVLTQAAAVDVQRIAGPARPLFARNIETALAYFQGAITGEPEEYERPWRLDGYNATEQEAAAFIEHCERFAGTSRNGFEYKTRKTFGVETFAMYAENVGSLLAWVWPNDNRSNVIFHPYRDSFFEPSFRDDAHRHYLPVGQWQPSYCADKLAMAGTRVASVQPFTFNGRQYVITGTTSIHGKREGIAWSLSPFSDWKGETFNYESQNIACCDGRIDRGDRRGLVVQVRGQLCVLDSAVTVYDDHVKIGEPDTYRHDEDDEAESETEGMPMEA